MLRAETLQELMAVLGPERCRTSRQDLLTYGYDACIYEFLPDAVLFPKSTRETAAIMKVAAARHVFVTLRGAGSGLGAESLAKQGGIVICFSMMNRIVEINTANRGDRYQRAAAAPAPDQTDPAGRLQQHRCGRRHGGPDHRRRDRPGDAGDEIVDFALSVGGTITGEHGIGINKAKYLPKQLSPTSLKMMRAIKQTFDPHGILNPGSFLDRLMKAMRAELLGRFRLSWEKKTAVHLLSGRRLLPFCMFWGRILDNPLRHLLPRQGRAGTIPYPRLPRLNAAPLLGQYPERVPARVPRTGRVLYFAGCASNFLYETVGHAVIGLLQRLGIEVLLPRGLMCCGFPVFLAGACQAALKNIRRNIQIMQAQEVDAI